jgi:hypothetical protein
LHVGMALRLLRMPHVGCAKATVAFRCRAKPETMPGIAINLAGKERGADIRRFGEVVCMPCKFSLRGCRPWFSTCS